MDALRARVVRRRRLGPALLLLAMIAPTTLRARDADGADRLFDRFIEDGEVISGGWLEGRLFFENWSAGERYGFGPFAAFSLAQDFEFGFAFAGMVADPEIGGSNSGLSDLALYGKVRLMEVPFVLSVGGMMTLPTGDERRGLGLGEASLEGFTGFRWYFDSVTLVANAGLRLNQDTDVPLLEGGFPGPLGATEGEISVLAGGGVIFLLSERWDFTTELAYESRRYRGQDADLRLTMGAAYRVGSAIFRGALTGGLRDGAPDFGLLGGAVLRF